MFFDIFDLLVRNLAETPDLPFFPKRFFLQNGENR